MSEINPLPSIADQLSQHASVESVYGAPIEFEGRTIVPVAKIGYGFGGGYGTSEEDEAASGGGGGGGLSASPIGVVELTDDGTRFIRFASKRRLVLAFLVGLIAGVALKRRR